MTAECPHFPVHRRVSLLGCITDMVFLEMFKADEFQDFSMNNWIRRLPPQMVTSHLNIDEATIKKIPMEKQEVLAG
jgi:oxalate decarboxylase